MQIQISHRGLDATDDLRARVEALASEIEAHSQVVELAKFVLEEREALLAAGVVLTWGENQETMVRHAEAGDWDRVFKDLSRRLERALEESAAASS